MKKIIILLFVVLGFSYSQAATIDKKLSTKLEVKKTKTSDPKNKIKIEKIKGKKKLFACATGVGTISGSCWAIDYIVDYCCDCDFNTAYMAATMAAQSGVRNYVWLLNILETELPC